MIPSPRFISLPCIASLRAIVKAVSPTFSLISENSSKTSPKAWVLLLPSPTLSLNLCPISTGNLPNNCPLTKSNPASAAANTPRVTPFSLSVTLSQILSSWLCTCLAISSSNLGSTSVISFPIKPNPAGTVGGKNGAASKLSAASRALNLLLADSLDFSSLNLAFLVCISASNSSSKFGLSG